VLPDIPGNAEQAALVERYVNLSGPIQRPVGRITAPFSRARNTDGESRLGQLIADTQLTAMRDAGAVLAFMNPGGIRAPLPYKDDGAITFADVYAVLPFENTLVTMTLTGAQILEILEQQWRGDHARVLAISSGFSYAWDPKAPVGKRVVPGSVSLNGQPLDAGRAYRIAVNSYMANGGDRFNMFTAGRDRTAGRTIRDALADYLRSNSPVTPASERRIRRLD
jgi:5'-nucleotidase